MELIVLNRNLDRLGDGPIDKFNSLRWIRRYNKAGEFELHVPFNIRNLELLQLENIIWKTDDKEAGYIEYRNIEMNSSGEEILIVKGKFITGYINRRIIWGIENLSTTAELAIRNLIDKNCINPTDANRKIDLLVLGELKNYTKSINYQTSYNNLLDEIEKIANVSELGYRTIIDIINKTMTFDIYEGRDLTTGQSINPPAIFSNEFENILEQSFTESLNNYKNLALVAGEGEGIDRELVTVEKETGIGLDRFEVFVDARDLQREDENDNIIPIDEYRNLLEDRGMSKLAEYNEIKTFENNVNVNGNLIYKQDFDLGDIVTCRSKKWGITLDTRITEIEEVYEGRGKEVFITFGNSMPNLIDVIKRDVK